MPLFVAKQLVGEVTPVNHVVAGTCAHLKGLEANRASCETENSLMQKALSSGLFVSVMISVL